MKIIFLVIALLLLVICIFSIKIEPRRISNGFFMETSIIFAYFAFTAFVADADIDSYGPVLQKIVLYLICIAIFVVGILLVIDFGLVLKREGLSIPNVLPLFFGILSMIVAALSYNDLSSGISGSMIYVKVISALYNVAVYIPYVIGAFLIYSIVYLHMPKTKNPGYIIVLGCRIMDDGQVTPLLRDRLDKAVRYYNKCGKKAKFVVSGGQGSDEVTSEAKAMKAYLVSQNIPENMIITEDKSVNTKENLLFSKEKIDSDGGGGDILICTSNYHVLRAVTLARSLKIDAQGIGGHTAMYYLPLAFFREYIAVAVKYKIVFVLYLFVAVLTGLLA